MTVTPDISEADSKYKVRETYSESVGKLIFNSIADLDRNQIAISTSVRFASASMAFIFAVFKNLKDTETISCQFAELKIDNNVLAVTSRGSFNLASKQINPKLEKFRLHPVIGRSQRIYILNHGVNGMCHVVQLAKGKVKPLGWYEIHKGLKGNISMFVDWQTGQIVVWEKIRKDFCSGDKQKIVLGQLKL